MSNNKSNETTVIAMIFIAISIASCTIGLFKSEDIAVRTAQAAGWRDITVVDRATVFISVRGCGNSDVVRFTVEGTNLNGEQQTAYVCAGLFKGGTMRTP